MPFPETPRVVYAHNPLLGVSCQLRFPPILRIDSEVPAKYQENIRASFPLFTEEETMPLDLPADLSQFFKANLSTHGSSRKTWKFSSEDNSWTLVLTRDFIALTTQRYRRWEEFREKLEMVCNSFFAEYNPSFLTRIGLRYQNVIDRNTLGLADVPWNELLQPHIAAEYSAPDVADAIQEAAHQVIIVLPNDQGKLGLRHGTARREGSSEVLYLVDNDFYADQRMETTNVLTHLDSFNRLAGRLFRWAISERLHSAMEPSPVP